MAELLPQMSTLELAIVGAVLLSWVAMAIALVSLARVKNQERLVRLGLYNLQRSLEINNSGLLGMGKKLLFIEKNLGQAKVINAAFPSARPGAAQPGATDHSAENAFGDASLLLKQGMALEQVMAATGLSRAEVSLMAMLRAPQSSVEGAH